MRKKEDQHGIHTKLNYRPLFQAIKGGDNEQKYIFSADLNQEIQLLYLNRFRMKPTSEGSVKSIPTRLLIYARQTRTGAASALRIWP